MEKIKGFNNTWTHIGKEQLATKTDEIETAIFRIGEERDFSPTQTIGFYPYSLANLYIPDWVNHSSWFIESSHKSKSLVNVHKNVDNLDHPLIFILSSSTKASIHALNSINKFINVDMIFDLAIPLDDSESDSKSILDTLNRLGFDILKTSTHAQMFWPSQNDLIGQTLDSSNYEFINPVTLDFTKKLLELFKKYYPDNSFHQEDLRENLHLGLIDNSNPDKELIAVCGRTEVIETSIYGHKFSILRDAVVAEKYRGKGLLDYLTYKLALGAYNAGAEILALDAINEYAVKQTARLGAKLLGHHRWYELRKKK